MQRLLSVLRNKLGPLAIALAVIGVTSVGAASYAYAAGGTTSFAGTSSGTSGSSKPQCPANITTKMCRLYKAMSTAATRGEYRWKSVGCYRSPDSYPYHPSGRACDLSYAYGAPATGASKDNGSRLKRWLVKNHAKYGIDHVMWRGRVYSSSDNWDPKGHVQSGCSGRNISWTGCHYDHVHVAVKV